MRLIAALAGAVMVLPSPALAHGPCPDCVNRTAARPGERLVLRSPAYRAIWNPAPDDFARQTTPTELASAYRADAPTATFERGSPRRPARRLALRVPDGTPPGVYMVLIFDGSEGGSHTTWSFVQVPGGPAALPAGSSADAQDSDDADGVPVGLAVGGAVLVALIAFGAGRRLARRSRS